MIKILLKFNAGDKVWTVRDRHAKEQKRCSKCKAVASGAIRTSYATSAIVEEVEVILRVSKISESNNGISYTLNGDKPKLWCNDHIQEKYIFLTRREARECAKRLNEESRKGGSK